MSSGTINAPIPMIIGNYQIAGSSSKTLHIANSTRGFFVTGNSSVTAKAIGVFHVTSAGATSVSLMNNPTGVTVTTGTNTITVANGTSFVLFVTFFMTDGNPPT